MFWASSPANQPLFKPRGSAMKLFKFNKIFISTIFASTIIFPFVDSYAASTTITLRVAGGGLSISAPTSGTPNGIYTGTITHSVS